MSYLCSSDPCRNGGTCTESSSQYQCQCPPGFTGIGCEVNIDECEGITCSVLNSVCHDLLLDYACVCAHGYIGNAVFLTSNTFIIYKKIFILFEVEIS